jgi:hypothetical protein
MYSIVSAWIGGQWEEQGRGFDMGWLTTRLASDGMQVLEYVWDPEMLRYTERKYNW